MPKFRYRDQVLSKKMLQTRSATFFAQNLLVDKVAVM